MPSPPVSVILFSWSPLPKQNTTCTLHANERHAEKERRAEVGKGASKQVGRGAVDRMTGAC